MQRSRLRSSTEENRSKYVKQINVCVVLLRESKREFLGTLLEKDLCDNKTFLGVVKPLLSNKFVSNEKITLVEHSNIVESNKNTASVLNEFFSNIITTLRNPQYNEGTN